jgi:hypothetical protein
MEQERNDNGHTYGQFMVLCDEYCLDHAGVSIEDLADGCSRDAWKDSVDPEEYAGGRLGAEGFPG